MNKNILLAILAIVFHLLIVGTAAAQNFSSLSEAVDASSKIPGSTIAEKCSTYYTVSVPDIGDTAKKVLSQQIDVHKEPKIITYDSATVKVTVTEMDFLKGSQDTMATKGVGTVTISNLTFLPTPPVHKKAEELVKKAIEPNYPRTETPIRATKDTLKKLNRSFVPIKKTNLIGQICIGGLKDMPTIKGVEYWKMTTNNYLRILGDIPETTNSTHYKVSFLNDVNYSESVGDYYRGILMATPIEPKELPEGVAAVYYNELWHCYIKKLFKTAKEADAEIALYLETYPELYANTGAYRQLGKFCGPLSGETAGK